MKYYFKLKKCMKCCSWSLLVTLLSFATYIQIEVNEIEM